MNKNVQRVVTLRRSLIALLVIGAISIGGCTATRYYAQAVGGHLGVMQQAKPIEERIADPATPALLRHKLERVLLIREFASQALGLPNNGSYRSYADLKRPFVIWNVVAAEEFSVKPKESCFPFTGCVAYRGFYDEADASDYANGLRAQGYDVFVYGVPAYSTLGWFNDPVLNTFINYPDAELARTIFHELAHQLVYIRDDSAFNESFAVAVEEEGVRRWLDREGTDADRKTYAAVQARKHDFIALVLRYQAHASELYARALGADTMRAEKVRLFAEMQADYERLKVSWGGFAGYDRWFARGLNNAHLASIATYTQFVPGFRALLAEQHGDLAAFYRTVRELAKRPKEERTAALGERGKMMSSHSP